MLSWTKARHAGFPQPRISFHVPKNERWSPLGVMNKQLLLLKLSDLQKAWLFLNTSQQKVRENKQPPQMHMGNLKKVQGWFGLTRLILPHGPSDLVTGHLFQWFLLLSPLLPLWISWATSDTPIESQGKCNFSSIGLQDIQLQHVQF